jgi:hypothetical protein
MNGPVRREGEGGVNAEVEEEVGEEEAHHGRAPEDLAIGRHQPRKSAAQPRKSTAQPRKSAARPCLEVQTLLFDLLLWLVNFTVLLPLL